MRQEEDETEMVAELARKGMFNLGVSRGSEVSAGVSRRRSRAGEQAT